MRAITTIILSTLLAAAPLAAGDEAAPAKGGKHAGAGRAKLLELFDANKDGKLDKTERAAARAACEARLLSRHPEADTNGDGTISREEFKAWHQAHGKGHHKGGKDAAAK